MQNNIVVIPSSALSHLKKKAKRLQRETGRPHHELLDEVAQGVGFPNWHHVTLAEAATKALEKRFQSELYVLMDIKEGLDLIGDDLEIAEDVMFLRRPELIEWLRSLDDDPEDEPEAELREFLDHNYLCLRYIGKEPLPSKANVATFVRELSFWTPQLIWVRGETIDLNNVHSSENESYDDDDGPDEPMPIIDEEILRAAFGPDGDSKLIVASPKTMEAYRMFSGPKKAWNWCLHCERAYPQGSYRQQGHLQMCPYSGCDGDAVIDLWKWPMVRDKNPSYPMTPDLGVEYALYGPDQQVKRRSTKKK